MSDDRRLTVNHDKLNDTVFVALHHGDASVIMRISAEEAQEIGRVGNMAAAHKETR